MIEKFLKLNSEDAEVTWYEKYMELSEIVTKQEKALTELTYALYLQKYLNKWNYLDHHIYENMRKLLKGQIEELQKLTPSLQPKTEKEIEELINMVL